MFSPGYKSTFFRSHHILVKGWFYTISLPESTKLDRKGSIS